MVSEKSGKNTNFSRAGNRELCKCQGKFKFLSKSVKSQGILLDLLAKSNAMCSKSRGKCKEIENEEKTISGWCRRRQTLSNHQRFL